MKRFRKIAEVKINHKTKGLMLHQIKPNNIFVYGYYQDNLNGCDWDAHFTHLEDAYELGEEFGIKEKDWTLVDYPQKGERYDIYIES